MNEETAQSGSARRKFTVKRAFEKASEVVVLSAHLYRELALSALSLLPAATGAGNISRRNRPEGL